METTLLWHITALLEQAREMARMLGVIIDPPTEMTTASIWELRANPTLWTVYKRRWEGYNAWFDNNPPDIH